MAEAREELDANILRDDGAPDFPRASPILVLANKQDLPDALRVQEIAEALRLSAIPTRPCHIQGTSSHTGDGLQEGLDWLCEAIRQQRRRESTPAAQTPTPR